MKTIARKTVPESVGQAMVNVICVFMERGEVLAMKRVLMNNVNIVTSRLGDARNARPGTGTQAVIHNAKHPTVKVLNAIGVLDVVNVAVTGTGELVAKILASWNIAEITTATKTLVNAGHASSDTGVINAKINATFPTVNHQTA